MRGDLIRAQKARSKTISCNTKLVGISRADSVGLVAYGRDKR